MSRRIPLFAVILSVLALAACLGQPTVTPGPAQTTPPVQPTPGAAVPVQLVQSNKPRAAATVPNADVAELAAGNAAFALDLYRELRQQEGNLFFSPYSISLALAMTYAGARGQTEQQMARTLHYTLPQDRLHPAFNALDRALASRGQGAKGKDEKGFRLKIANALWGQAGYAFRPEFLDMLALNYGAGLRLLNFGQPEPARETINQWVSDQTEKRIPQLLSQGALTPDTRLVLTNAIYFNAAWAQQFDKQATQDGPFHLLDGQTVNTPMMLQGASFGHAAGDGYQAVELPYAGNELAMLIVLPEAGQFERVESSLDAAQLDALVKGLKFDRVTLTLPRWKFESSFSLAGALHKLGMSDAVSAGLADFSGMDGTRTLFIGEVVHKAFVAVDESGTEAAAATAVIMPASGMPGEPVKITVDRPFLLFIRDRATETLLFAGRVVNPQ